METIVWFCHAVCQISCTLVGMGMPRIPKVLFKITKGRCLRRQPHDGIGLARWLCWRPSFGGVRQANIEKPEP